jgi:hypothetical protein
MKIGRVVETIKPRLKLENSNRGLAQLVERHPYKVDVVGSSPASPTKYLKSLINLKSSIGRVFRVVKITFNQLLSVGCGARYV